MLPTMAFSPQGAGVPDRNATLLAKASITAYEKNQIELNKALRRAGFSNSTLASFGQAQAFIAEADEVIWIVFRGTERNEFGDWLLDARSIQTPWTRGLVHSGFDEAMVRMWDKNLEAYVLTLLAKHRNARVWFAGHSLGGALAELATARFVLGGGWERLGGLYSFGKPRVGNPDYSAWCFEQFGSKSFRFVNNNDLVTRVPRRSMGYMHLGEGAADVYYFRADGSLVVGPTEWDSFLNKADGFVKQFLGFMKDPKNNLVPDDLRDHASESYAKNLAMTLPA